MFALTLSTLLSWTMHKIAKDIELNSRLKIETLARGLTSSDLLKSEKMRTLLIEFLGSEALVTNRDQTDLKINWQSSFAATSNSVAWLLIIGVPVLVLLCLILSPTMLYKMVIIPQSVQLAAFNTEKKTHQSLQMFAHDIRKPFSALKAILGILNKKQGHDELEGIIKKFLPEIDALLSHVDGMISDLLSNGKEKSNASSTLVSSLDKIMTEAVSESAKRHTNCELPIAWNLQHTLKPNAGEKALVRCFSNLICNAIEATGKEDKLWIKSRDSNINGVKAVEVTIGNSGKPIPKEVLSKLFTPFFTTGKKEGTGLGLAYVKKTLDELAGYAAARSDETRGTEFILTIPALTVLDKVTRDLPISINPKSSKESIIHSAQQMPVKILVIEDQDIYYESIRHAVLGDSSAPNKNQLHHVKTYAEAAEAFEKLNFDIIICDIDLGSNEKSGIDVIKLLKTFSSCANIYVYSNKSMTPSEQRFVELSTNGAIRKPACALELSKILAKVTNSRKTLPIVAVIDDDCFVRELWDMQSDVIEPHLFSSPEEFLTAMKSDPSFLHRFDAFIVDYYFSEASEYTGDQIAIKIRAGVNTPIIMSSDVQSVPEQSRSAFNGQISKDCQSWDVVQKLLQTCA